jgi:hypothetical protein
MAVSLLLAMLLAPPATHAEVSSEARTPAEIYERKAHLLECLRYVARDLKARWEADRTQPPAELVLVVDPTTSMKDEIRVLRQGLPQAWKVGPEGLRIGVYGIATDTWTAPSRLPNQADGALAALAFLPIDGPRNMLAWVRRAARRMGAGAGGPRAVLLVSQEYDGGEDDVEATRDALVDTGAAFYCVAGEAGFERAWLQEFKARDYPELGITERYNPEPRKRVKDSLYYGGETAFGLVPYRWEFDLAQADFVWVRPPRYPVPSGFGYWPLATLSYTTGGRYFIYDFTLPADHPSRLAPHDPKARKTWLQKRRQTTYDFARLALLAPDLRPRAKVLKNLSHDWRAQTIVRIWEHLANDAVPVLQRMGTLERRGSTLVTRPERPLRSQAAPLTWFEDMDGVKKATAFVRERLRATEQALKWWQAANARERPKRPGEDPLAERIEADFQLLGVQLRKVRFHHGEALAALKSIKPLDVTYRRVRIVPQVLTHGADAPPKRIDLGDEQRNARFAEAWLAQARMVRKYPGTPWSLVLQKGWMMTFRKVVEILEPDPGPSRHTPDPRRGGGKSKGGKKKGGPKPKPPTPPPPPPPGPRPGSGSGGPITGK